MAVALYEVPQPWRGYITGILLLTMTLGLVLLRFFRHWFHYKEVQIQARMQARGQQTVHTLPTKQGGGGQLNLKVVTMQKERGGRSRM